MAAEETTGVLGKRSHSSSPTPAAGAPLGKQAKTKAEPLRIGLGPAEHYAQSIAATAFQQPTRIASFSYDESRSLHHDDRSRRYYHSPPHHADLNRGFEDLVQRDDEVNEHLDSLLLALTKLHSEGRDEERRRAELITWRGMMTKLCTLLYDNRQGFEMNAMMVGHTLYLEEHVGPSQRADKARQQDDARLKRFGYYGYSFESWTCAKEASPVDPWDGNVNTNVQWCSIVKTKLGKTRCILAGEVDAVDPKTKAPIEVKTSMQIRTSRDEERFETKMLRFYMQSFLLGIALVVVGFRDHRGFLVTHQEFETLTMPRAVRGKAHGWNPTACLNLASQLLTSIRSHIGPLSPTPPPCVQEAEKSEGYPVYRISFDVAAKEVTVAPLSSEDIRQQVKAGKEVGRVGFLLSDYYHLAVQSL